MIEKLTKADDSEFPYIDEKGVSWESKTSYIQIQVLGFCGCGNPYDVMNYVKDFLVNISEKIWGDYEDMPYMFLCYWANHNGFAEHGTTARCCWLTDKGYELLKDIEWCIENEKESDEEMN